MLEDTITGFIEVCHKVNQDPEMNFRQLVHDAALFRMLINSVEDRLGYEVAKEFHDNLEKMIDESFEDMKAEKMDVWDALQSVFGNKVQ